MTIRILLVDDHSVVRQGLRMFLGLDPDLEVVGEASNGAEGIELVRKLHPDVVLMDLLMPVMDGITAIQNLRKEFPDVEVIALTSILEDDKVVGAVRAGAIGYLLKDTQADELRRAIKAAANGQVQLSPQAAARLVREIKSPDSPEKLTERETDVLRLLALGSFEQGDRQRTGDRGENGQDAREQYFDEVGAIQPYSGGVARGANRTGAFGIMTTLRRQSATRAIFEAVNDALFIFDLDGRPVECNPASQQLFGYTLEEFLQLHTDQLIHPESRPAFATFGDDVRAGRDFRARGQLVRKDGSLFHADVRGQAFTHKGRPHALAIVRDVSEEVAATHLLEQRVEERTRELAMLSAVSQSMVSTC
jgi:two-component system, NarL family, response regulator LiaR